MKYKVLVTTYTNATSMGGGLAVAVAVNVLEFEDRGMARDAARIVNTRSKLSGLDTPWFQEAKLLFRDEPGT